VADSICRAEPGATVLVVCVELCTLHLQLEPTEANLLANSLFGDGACAVLLRAQPAEAGLGPRASLDAGAAPRLAISRCASWLEVGTEREMAWTVGDHGFEMQLSAMVPKLLGLHVGGFLEEAMGVEDSALKAMRFWAIHPGGPAILDEIERSLVLDPSLLLPSRAILREFGNMSSPTIMFVIDRIWREMRGGSGRGIALAFGPGLTLEAILFEVMP
jgi:predicted naringenin-chalcone synthase